MTWPIVFVAFQLFGVAFVVRPGVRLSRRLLAGVIALMVPLAGPLLGVLVRHGKGRGTSPPIERHLMRGVRMSAIGVIRMNALPPILDRLMSSDAAVRLAALVTLATIGDASAVALLRFTLEHGTTEVALDAALALEELDIRRAARREATRRALDEAPSFAKAFAAAEAAADAVQTQLGDGPCAEDLADTARAAYQVALDLDPERSAQIDERLAHLELAAGRPEVALDHLSRLAAAPAADAPRLTALRDRAVFAARRFDLILR